MDFSSWAKLYASLLSSVINPSSNMVHLNTINQQIDSNLSSYDRDNPIVDFPTLFIAYQSLRNDALSLNLLTNNNERLVDVANRSQSPYTTGYAFATAPVLGTDDDGDVTFMFRTGLFVNSSQKTFGNFQVDFGNGAGYQSMTANVPKNIIYSSSGEKTLKFKIQFTDGTTYYSHSKFYILNSTQGNPQARYSGNDARAFKFPRSTDSNCLEPSFPNPQAVGGSFYGATVTVEYGAIGNRPVLGCVPQFIKPLIVLEGLDVGKFIGSNHSYSDFISEDIRGGIFIDANPNQSGTQLFGDRLEAAGYDLIFVDYEEGAGDIVRNAYLLENIIQWVNIHKINNPVTGLREGNVVLGQSMGGLIGRYAVCDMEKRWAASPSVYAHHEVRMFVSHDSGHRGSHIPLGFQATLNDLATVKLGRIGLATFGIIGGIIGSKIELKDVVGILRKAHDLLNIEPGPKQMLIVQDGSTNTFLNGQYRSVITFAAGYTPSFTMRALANGSECGVGQLVNPGGEILYFDSKLYVHPLLFVSTLAAVSTTVTSINPDLGFLVQGALSPFIVFTGKRWKSNYVVNATPTSGTNQAYKAKISFEKKILFVININIDLVNSSRNSIPGTLPWDSSAGGYYGIQELKIKNPNIKLYPILEVDLTVRAARTFGHVPTVSALDISTSLTAAALASPYTGGNNPNYPSSFPTFKTQEKLEEEVANSFYNTRHIQFTARNANWIFNEMEGIAQPPSSCAYLCLDNQAILGASVICTSEVYQLSNLASGVPVIWSSTWNSPPYPQLVHNSPSANQLTINNTYSYPSSTTLKATINGECGTREFTKNIG